MAPVERTHAVTFTIPEGGGQFQWYADVAGIRWVGEISGDTMTLFPDPPANDPWRRVGRLEGLPASTGRELDLSLHPEWRPETIEERLGRSFERWREEHGREPNCTTVDQWLRERAGALLAELGLRRDLRDRLVEALLDLCERAVNEAASAAGLSPEEQEAVRNVVRAVRRLPYCRRSP